MKGTLAKGEFPLIPCSYLLGISIHNSLEIGFRDDYDENTDKAIDNLTTATLYR